MKSIFVTFLVLLGCSLSLGCPTCPTPAPSPTPSPPTYVPSNSTVILPCPPAAARCPKSWNYQNASRWGSFCPSWSKCSQGKFQSPVDIYTPGPLPSRTPSSFLNNGHHYNEQSQANPFSFNYSPFQGTFFNTGNFFTLTGGSKNNTFDYNGVLYFLSRVEFHSPSEHTVNGYRYDIEMELIHESGVAGSKLLAVSVFFDRGDKQVNCSQTNFFLESLQFNLPQFSTPRCSPTEWNGKFDCCVPNCTLPICGNGVLERGEQCDNGKNNSNSAPGACRTNCLKAACGDGFVDPYEQCDDGNFRNGDGCSNTCQNECGNGALNLKIGEQCDQGSANSNTAPNACRLNCRTAYCGDGVVDQGEQCDNSTARNGNNPGQCRKDCTLPRCGDGILDPLEQCDNGAQNGPGTTCTSSCVSLCGDGVVQSGEDCDYGADNNNSPNSACRTNCRNPRCGDGIVDTILKEQCDNAGAPDRFCSANCQQLCGNGRVESGEECDYGCSNSFSPNSCRPDCTNPVCGDGILDKGEECDNGKGNTNSVPGACRMNCTLPKCGDSVVDPGEQCDNGRNTAGSGCNNCHSECGNGILDAGEECDFGALNSNTSDSCRTDCRHPRCGDGVLDRLEVCDDGPRNGATPNNCRTDCSLPYCGDGIVDVAYGEYCDNGAANSDYAEGGCSSTCLPNLCRQIANGSPVTVDLNAALPKNKTAFTYDGSLTSPPCTEGVKWIIFPELQFITQFQYEAFTSSPYGYNSSYRPLQELGWSRKITRPFKYSGPTCGNGIVEGTEECDLGFLRNSDKTSSLCRKDCTRPRCGDGVVDRGEECDDGYNTPHCSTSCTLKKVRFNPFVCPAWSYSATCKWSDLCPAWGQCDGTRPAARQSPINFNLSSTAATSLGRGQYALPAQYSTSAVTLVNTGRVVSFLVNNSQSTLNINTTTYTLNRIDFHSPSEHTFNGQHATLEAQFIHTSASGNTVAVSVLYNKARGSGLVRNQFIEQFWLFLPRDSDCRCGNGVVDFNEQCDNGAQNSDSKPDHCRRNCMKPRCGDGVVDRWEQCDDGFHNRNASNSCKPGSCKRPFCGDGYVDAGEQCDPAATPATCSQTCHLFCGDGNQTADELCDNGAKNSDTTPDACRTTCTPATCGDLVVDSNEQCDDGPKGSTTCRLNCRKASCGDGVVDLYLGEECDGGAGCSPSCTRLCGDGKVDAGEDCDNGHQNSNTAGNCRTNCKRPTCGDFIVDTAEQCDQGPTGTIYCSANCVLLCGNGVKEGSEECDDGSLNADATPNTCRTNCRRPSCGDGVKDMGEECDFGAQNGNGSTSPCRLNCVLPRCGDGIVDAQEQCDDGNHINGDGCTATCWNECGNGRRDGTEECDDGEANAKQPNACRPNCKRAYCGDGIVDSGEQCDDGALNSDTAPNACRRSCTLPVRGDGIVDDLYGEKCDSTQLNDFSGNCSTTNILNICRTSRAPASRLVDLSLAFDKTSPVLTYDGSSTTPPCQEGWKWFVFQKIQTVDETQFERLVAYFPASNSRGPQPLNGRTFSYTSTVPAVCGNGLVERTEECDEGELNSNSPDSCRTNCKRPACGDGILDAGELCDDGAKNSASGPCGTDCKWAGFEGCAPGNKTCTAPGSTTINVIFANLLSGAKCTGNCPQA